MKKEVGIWIDQREAVIVTLQDQSQDIQRIEGHLDHFYDEVITHLTDATAILIMGPGDAKNQFHKHLETSLPLMKVVNVEAADKMSDELIVAKVRRNFQLYEYTH